MYDDKFLVDRLVLKDRYSGVYITEPNTAVFTLWDFHGRFGGFHQYRADVTEKRTNDPRSSRYYTRVGKHGWCPWGLETIKNVYAPLFIAEGVFDIAPFHFYGLQGLAVLTRVPPKASYEQFFVHYPGPVILLEDGDLHTRESWFRKHVDCRVVCATGKDPGDFTFEEVELINDSWHLFKELHMRG